MIRLGCFDRPREIVRLAASAAIAAGLVVAFEVVPARAADLDPCEYRPCGPRSEAYPPLQAYPAYPRPEYRPHAYPALRYVPERYGYRSYEPNFRAPYVYNDPYERHRGRYVEEEPRPPAVVPGPPPRRWGGYQERYDDYALEDAPPNHGWREERRERW